jgi:DNA-binding NarL/FixJ family response regulator
VVPEEGRELRLLVVDDHRTFADALCLALAQLPDVAECIAEPTIDRAMARLAGGGWDVVVIDAYFSGRDGLDGAAEVQRRWPEVRIVMITGEPELDHLAEAAALGVDAYVTKDLPFTDLRDAVLAEGPEDLGHSDVLAMVVEAIRRREEARRRTPTIDLTPREREVLGLLARGVAMKDMAGLLGIKLETCRGYVKTLLAKLGARSQLQAVVYAAREGLLDDDGRPHLRSPVPHHGEG